MLFYGECYSNIDLYMGVVCRIFDFVKLVDVYGCVGLCCDWFEDVDVIIE